MLHDIPGRKIRRQFFNIPIYLVLVVYTFFMSVFVAMSIKDNTLTSGQFLSFIFRFSAIAIAILFPLLILSILNRFCFGQVICVLNEKGLYYDDGWLCCIPWSDIKAVAYEPDIPVKIGWRYECENKALITTKPFKKETVIELEHAPWMLIRKMKRYQPNAKYGFTKWGIGFVLCIALLPIATVLITLFS